MRAEKAALAGEKPVCEWLSEEHEAITSCMRPTTDK